MRKIFLVSLSVFVFALAALTFLGSSPPHERPLARSQQEAAGKCPSGAALPKVSRTEGFTDGRPDAHSYYPCTDGSTVDAQ